MTTSLDPSRTLGSLVLEQPQLAKACESLGLDYCCGGDQRLDAACAAAGLDIDDAINHLTSHLDADAPADSWAELDLVALVDHIEATHHTYLRDELPRLSALAARVEQAHLTRHRELAAVRTTFEQLRAELEPHLAKEEQVLFPMIRLVATATERPRLHCGELRNPIAVMTSEHDYAGAMLSELRTLTGGFEPPGDACASYLALYDGLAHLEADTHSHVHKENNALFPRAIAAEAAFD